AFAPMTRDEFFHVAKGFRAIYVDGLCQIAELEGETVGFILGLPDINVGIRACNGRLLPFGFLRFLRAMKKTKRFRVMTLGILPEYRGRGLDAFLITNHIEMSVPTGYSDAELSWVLEDNIAMIKPLREMNAAETIRLRLYEQAL
ncbi:MAG TPA: GNAT family N-acetyltransferase, partial [Planctomycetota bacterium]|nr:GNAT family N-acetyltransferase [Planctomycetota bacterium]